MPGLPSSLQRTSATAYAPKNEERQKTTMRDAVDDIALVVNPNSCSGLTGKDWDNLFLKIKKVLGNNIEVAFTKKPGEGTELARDFLRKGFTKIAAIGGDGTINEVANGFFEDTTGIRGVRDTQENTNKIRTDTSMNNTFPSPLRLKPINPDAMMAVVPCGTRNVLARSLGLPEGVVQCCRTFSLGNPRKIDIISATVTNPTDHSIVNTRIVLNAVEMGAAAEIIDRSKKVREVINSRMISTIAGIISTLPAYQSNTCQVNFEKCNGHRGEFIAKITMAIVANGQFLGGGFKAAPKADMSDSLLDLVILRDSGSFKMLDELVSMKEGDYSEEDNIFYTQMKKVSLSSKERDVTVTVDGEPIGILPATFEIIPNALTVRM